MDASVLHSLLHATDRAEIEDHFNSNIDTFNVASSLAREPTGVVPAPLLEWVREQGVGVEAIATQEAPAHSLEAYLFDGSTYALLDAVSEIDRLLSASQYPHHQHALLVVAAVQWPATAQPILTVLRDLYNVPRLSDGLTRLLTTSHDTDSSRHFVHHQLPSCSRLLLALDLLHLLQDAPAWPRPLLSRALSPFYDFYDSPAANAKESAAFHNMLS